MLKEDQAAELLRRFEAAVGRRLAQTRGNLKHAETRAAALWELIVIDAAAQIGHVAYESPSGGPDVRLQLSEGPSVWLESTFLDSRFWKDERKSDAVTTWIAQELRRRRIPPGRIHCRFEPVADSEAGPKLRLPELDKGNEFLNEPRLKSFLEMIQARGSEDRDYVSPIYSVSLHYSAQGEGPYFSSSGPRLEAPENVDEHALYRLLMNKARQHDVELPRVVCVAGDRTPMLSSFCGTGTTGHEGSNTHTIRPQPIPVGCHCR